MRHSGAGMARTRIVAAPLAALVLAACGASGPARIATTGGWPSRHPICLRASLAAMARSLAVPSGAISHSISTGNNGSPQCLYRARRARGAVEVLANVETTQGAYFIVERTIVEAAQLFTPPRRLEPAPLAVPGLGLEASWFPQEQWLISTDGYRIITASVDWTGASQQRKIALARAVTVPYLHTPHGKRAQQLAKGYPSG